MRHQKASVEGFMLDSVSKSLKILKCFTSERPVHRVSELSRTLNMNKSSVSRILSTLANEGFVIKDENSRTFRLGTAALIMGNACKYSFEVYSEARPILMELVENLNETVQLAILDRTEVVFIESMECKHPLRYMASVGSRSPVHCSSSGKALLAFRNDDLIEQIIEAGLPRWTARTITNEQSFREEIARIRKQGFALSLEERFEGVIAVAAPVFDDEGNAVAAVNVVGPTYRMKQENLNRCIRHLVRAAEKISQSMGYNYRKS